MKLTLFDLDGTLIPGDSCHAFGEFLIGIGWADRDDFLRRHDEFFQQYLAGQLDIHAYMDFASSAWRHRPEADQQDARQRFMTEMIKAQIQPAALELVRSHQRQGDLVAMATSADQLVAGPIAAAFGIDHLIAVRLERDASGAITGRIRGTPSFQEGKSQCVDDWLHSLGRAWEEFEQTQFYSDSTNDLPLLERASIPVATNPVPALAAIAAERGWRVLRL